jgi:hypothetical protein
VGHVSALLVMLTRRRRYSQIPDRSSQQHRSSQDL